MWFKSVLPSIIQSLATTNTVTVVIMATSVSNVHVSKHPCLRAKLSLLRSKATNARDTKQLVHEIATIVGCEALAQGLKTTETGKVRILVFIRSNVVTSPCPALLISCCLFNRA